MHGWVVLNLVDPVTEAVMVTAPGVRVPAYVMPVPGRDATAIVGPDLARRLDLDVGPRMLVASTTRPTATSPFPPLAPFAVFEMP